MALPKESPDAPGPRAEDAAEHPVGGNELEAPPLRERAVAIDPPPSGAIGIEELLGRFERFAEAQAMTDLPEKGPVGVRELLTRLGNLADAGYFSSSRDDDPDQEP